VTPPADRLAPLLQAVDLWLQTSPSGDLASTHWQTAWLHLRALRDALPVVERDRDDARRWVQALTTRAETAEARCAALDALVVQVRALRVQQRWFFKTKARTALVEAKRLEALVDAALPPETPDPPAP
jgi:hypothetical protein